MIRNISFILVLFITLSIVNAIPHKLHKRVINFDPCVEGSFLDITISPDPPIPGGTAKLTVVGPLKPAAKAGSMLAVGFFAAGEDDLVAPPLRVDLCTEIDNFTCPASKINASGPLEIPAKLPVPYDMIVAIFDPAGEVIACAGATAGGS